MAAAFFGHANVVAALLARGANAQATDRQQKRSSLHWAALNDHTQVRYLRSVWTCADARHSYGLRLCCLHCMALSVGAELGSHLECHAVVYDSFTVCWGFVCISCTCAAFLCMFTAGRRHAAEGSRHAAVTVLIK